MGFLKPKQPAPVIPIKPVNPEQKFVINQAGLELVKHFEGCSLRAYKDSVGIWTIGWGRIVYDDNSPVKQGDSCDQKAADRWLMEDLESEGAHYVRAWVKTPLNENEFSALTSFTYNRGAGRLKEKIVGLLNAGKKALAADTMLEYDWAGADHKVLAGLARRRKAERELFLGGDWTKFKA